MVLSRRFSLLSGSAFVFDGDLYDTQDYQNVTYDRLLKLRKILLNICAPNYETGGGRLIKIHKDFEPIRGEVINLHDLEISDRRVSAEQVRNSVDALLVSWYINSDMKKRNSNRNSNLSRILKDTGYMKPRTSVDDMSDNPFIQGELGKLREQMGALYLS